MGITDIFKEIADAIRKKSGTYEKMQPAEMAGKIMEIGFPIIAFAENTANGCHVNFGTQQDNDYTMSLSGCILSGTNKLAFTFTGTGFDIIAQAENSAIRVSVYDASQFELKQYTYESNGEQKTYIGLVKKSGAPADAKALTTIIVFVDGTIDKTVDMEKYGTYVVVAQKTGSTDVQVDGIKVNT